MRFWIKMKIKVKPGSGKQEIKKIGDENYIVSLKKPAQDNKANIELLKLLKKYFKQEVRIVKGFKSKNKIIKIRD